MVEVTAKDKIKNLINDAIDKATRESIPIEKFYGLSLFDPSRDEIFLSLEGFSAASAALMTIPNFVVRFGHENITRIVCNFYINISNALVY